MGSKLQMFLFLSVIFAIKADELHITVISASFNNEKWCERSLKSVFEQNYSNYHVVYINDQSTDKTFFKVSEIVSRYNAFDHFLFINNREKNGAMANQYRSIHMCNPKDIIMILDGDDWLAHSDVFSYINRVYQNENIWLTYGQFKEYPSNKRGFCCPMPSKVITLNLFREFTHIPSHLRTFYAALFHKISKEDLMFQGNFFQMDADIAAMFPMIEMARNGHFKFISDVLLIYNSANNLNDYKVSKQLQRALDLHIRSKKKYELLPDLFNG